MTVYLYDGTEDGFLSCVFDAYQNKTVPGRICEEGGFQLCLETDVRHIRTDKEKAERVKRKLKELSLNSFYDITCALSSSDPEKGTTAYNFIRLLVSRGGKAREMQANPDVMAFDRLLFKVTCEIHRFKGFLRFEETAGGWLYAHYSPDNDITKMIVRHFFARLGKIPFCIHDVKRNIIALSNGSAVKVVKGDGQITVYLSDAEKKMQDLWRTYYKSVNIKERKNLRLMRGFMPVRYWVHMPEKRL